MKKTLAGAMVLGLAACGGEEPKVATVAATNAKAIAAPAATAKPDADKELEQRVGRALGGAKLYNVDVVAEGGMVTLWGSAPTAKEVTRAIEIAAQVPGVKAVANRLDVVSGS